MKLNLMKNLFKNRKQIEIEKKNVFIDLKKEKEIKF
jgi:hypothetical protein